MTDRLPQEEVGFWQSTYKESGAAPARMSELSHETNGTRSASATGGFLYEDDGLLVAIEAYHSV